MMRRNPTVIAGLVLIALVAAIGLAAVAMSTDEPSEPQAYTAADDGTSIELKAGESFSIVLEGNPTTGYSWEVGEFDTAVLVASEPEYVTDSDLTGSGGTYTFTFTASAAGEAELHLEYLRPWEQAEPLESFTITVTVG